MMGEAEGLSRRDLQPFPHPVEAWRPAVLAWLHQGGDPRFGVQGIMEAMPLLGPQVCNLGSASTLREMLSEIHPIFFIVSFVSVISLSKRRCFCFCFVVVVAFFFFFKEKLLKH